MIGTRWDLTVAYTVLHFASLILFCFLQLGKLPYLLLTNRYCDLLSHTNICFQLNHYHLSKFSLFCAYTFLKLTSCYFIKL